MQFFFSHCLMLCNAILTCCKLLHLSVVFITNFYIKLWYVTNPCSFSCAFLHLPAYLAHWCFFFCNGVMGGARCGYDARSRICCSTRALLVPQHVRGGRWERGALALQVLRQRGVQPLAPLPFAHGSTFAVPLLPCHIQSHRHTALTLAPEARRYAAQTLNGPS